MFITLVAIIFLIIATSIEVGTRLNVLNNVKDYINNWGKALIFGFTLVSILCTPFISKNIGFSVISENTNFVQDYAPFSQGSKVAVLSEEPSLKISDNFPKLDGSAALYSIYSSFVRATYDFSGNQKNIALSNIIKCSDTDDAYKRIVDGDSDIIFVTAPSKEQEEYAKKKGVKLIYTPIGEEAFVFFVNAKNPIDNITIEQIQKIYSGEITTWNELGVSNLGKIRAYQREYNSNSQNMLIRIMGGKEPNFPPSYYMADGKGGAIRKTAEYRNYKNAVGFSFRYYASELLAKNQVKLLKIGGIAPTNENIENATYHLFSHFYAVTRSQRDANTEKLVNWILSEQGQDLIESSGYFPID